MLKTLTNYINKYNLVLSEDFIQNAIRLMKIKEFYVSDFYQMLLIQLKILKW